MKVAACWREKLGKNEAGLDLSGNLVQALADCQRRRQQGVESIALLRATADLQAIQGLLKACLQTQLEIVNLLVQQQAWEPALEQLNRTISLSPQNTEARRIRLSLLLHLGRHEEAVAQASQLSCLYLQLGQGVEAIDMLLDLRRQMPYSWQVRQELAEAYLGYGQMAEAQYELRWVVDQHLEAQRFDAAGCLLRRLRILAPENLALSLELGLVLARLERYGEAEREFRSILRTDLNHHEALLYLGQVCHTSGQYRDSLLAYRRLLSLNLGESHEEGPFCRFSLEESIGDVYAAMGMAEAGESYVSAAWGWLSKGSGVARAWLCAHKILALYPDHVEARELAVRCQALSSQELPAVDLGQLVPAARPPLAEAQAPVATVAKKPPLKKNKQAKPTWEEVQDDNKDGLIRKVVAPKLESAKPALQRPVAPLEPPSDPVMDFVWATESSAETRDWSDFPAPQMPVESPAWSWLETPLGLQIEEDFETTPQFELTMEDVYELPAAPVCSFELPEHVVGLDFSPAHLESLCQRLQAHRQEPQFATARAQIEDLQQRLQSDPDQLALRFQLAHLHMSWGQPGEARSHLRELVTLRPHCLPLRLRLLEAHLWSDDFEAATCCLIDAASILSQSGNPAAVEALQLALTLDPDNSSSSLQLVELLENLGAEGLAQNQLRRLARGAGSPAPLRACALRRLLQNAPNKADRFLLIGALREAREKGFHTDDPLVECEELWTSCAGDPLWASLVCETALELTATQPAAWLGWAERKWEWVKDSEFGLRLAAQLLLTQADATPVIPPSGGTRVQAILDQVAENQLEAASQATWLHLSILCALDSGQNSRAQQLYKEWRPSVHPLAGQVQQRCQSAWSDSSAVVANSAEQILREFGPHRVVEFAEGQLAEGRPENAFRALRRLAEIWPAPAQLHWRLAELAGRLGHSSIQVEHLEKICQVEPNHVLAQLCLAQTAGDCSRLVELVGRAPEARADVLAHLTSQADQLMSAEPVDGSRALALAQQLSALGEWEQALHVCQRLRRLRPWAATALARGSRYLAESGDKVLIQAAVRQIEKELKLAHLTEREVQELSQAQARLLAWLR